MCSMHKRSMSDKATLYSLGIGYRGSIDLLYSEADTSVYVVRGERQHEASERLCSLFHSRSIVAYDGDTLRVQWGNVPSVLLRHCNIRVQAV